MHPVELITASHHHSSAGDLATSETTAYELARRGLPVLPRETASGDRVAIIGGGHILGNLQHGGQQYHLEGTHVLNAAGILNEECDFRYLANYRYVSVRDVRSMEILARQNIAAEYAPCPAMLIQPIEKAVWHPRSVLSRYASACRDKVVIEANPKVFNKLPAKHQVIAIHTQAWLSHGKSFNFMTLPAILTPRMIVTAIQEATCVVTCSLHTAIFALATSRPLCVIARGDGPQSTKIKGYFERAGFTNLIWDAVRDPVRQALDEQASAKEMRDVERTRAEEHLDRMVSACASGLH